MKVAINKERIPYLLALFDMTKEELLERCSVRLKAPLLWRDIYCDNIDINYLKRVDGVFVKGLFYYSDPNTPQRTSSGSVFFRKTTFATPLTTASKLRVREFEDMKTHVSALADLTELSLHRKLPTYRETDDARDVAFALRKDLLPGFDSNERNFLKSFINKIGEHNILVFEFIDAFNKKEKSNIDGFYLHPETIVLKRYQHAFSRELFTLAHEIGHFLLDQEEVESIDFDTMHEGSKKESNVERWCNRFAYYLMAGQDFTVLLEKNQYDATNDYGYEIVQNVSQATHLSKLAIFTNLMLNHKLSYDNYCNIKKELEDESRQRAEQRMEQKQMNESDGMNRMFVPPVPILSNITLAIYNAALNSGVINEADYCRELKVSPSKLEKLRYL